MWFCSQSFCTQSHTNGIHRLLDTCAITFSKQKLRPPDSPFSGCGSDVKLKESRGPCNSSQLSAGSCQRQEPPPRLPYSFPESTGKGRRETEERDDENRGTAKEVHRNRRHVQHSSDAGQDGQANPPSGVQELSAASKQGPHLFHLSGSLQTSRFLAL